MSLIPAKRPFRPRASPPSELPSPYLDLPAWLTCSELQSIPGDLRECLEQCLSEEPSQETLNLYLPTIRTIIFNLLNGLKQKQAAYKRLVQERTETPPPVQYHPPPSRPLDPPPPIVDPEYGSRLSARSNTPSNMSVGSGSPSSVISQLPAKLPSSQALAERARAGQPNRPPPPDAFRPPRRAAEQPRRDISPQNQMGHGHYSSGSGSGELPHLVRHQLSDNPVPSPSSSSSLSSQQNAPPPPPPPKPVPHPDRFSRDSLGKPVSRFSMDSEITNGSPGRSISTHSPPRGLASLSEDEDEQQPAPPAVVAPPLLPTLNLPSSTLGFGDVEPPSPPIEVPPETRATLAALGRSEALERRASKRFSSYTFNKLPGSPSRNNLAQGDSPQRPTRRGDRPPPMPALPEALASSNLGVSGADRERSKSPSPVLGLIPPQPEDEVKSSSASSKTSRSNSSSASQEGSVRILNTPESSDVGGLATPRPSHSPTAATSAPTSVFVFLQLGRQVKKTSLDLPVSLSSLRLLFMERFDYDPGVEDFPDVYIRDNATGLQFELEDLEELKENSLLTLNIEREPTFLKFSGTADEQH